MAEIPVNAECFLDLDVWRGSGNCRLFSRRPYFPQEKPLQVANRSERCEEELDSSGRSLDGRLRKVLL